MLFVKTDDLKPGMRIARPIYNRMGVMLYERNSKLTMQSINSIQNFGLIGLFILEPAEPLPPLTQEDIEFEQFQTVSMFQIRDAMVMLKNEKEPKQLDRLAKEIIKRYGSLNHKIAFTQNLRSTTDFVYKHSISCAILVALISNEMKLNQTEQLDLVYAALLYDFGILYAPSEILEKSDDLSDSEAHTLQEARKKGLAMLKPDQNPFHFPEGSLEIIRQILNAPSSSEHRVPSSTHFSRVTQILQVVDRFDFMTAMHLNREPVSELKAIRYLQNYPKLYSSSVVEALSRCIHILPVGACVDLSNLHKGLVVAENKKFFLSPIVLDFETNELLDLSDREVIQNIHIVDIMKTMDNRISIDRVSLKLFQSDPHTKAALKHFLHK